MLLSPLVLALGIALVCPKSSSLFFLRRETYYLYCIRLKILNDSDENSALAFTQKFSF